MVPGNLLKEKDIWKRKVETLELKCSSFQTDLFTLQKGVRVAHSLQKAMQIIGSRSPLAARVIKLEGSLQDAEKWEWVASYSIEEKSRHVEDTKKPLFMRMRH